MTANPMQQLLLEINGGAALFANRSSRCDRINEATPFILNAGLVRNRADLYDTILAPHFHGFWVPRSAHDE
jgi:hypothetical protein